MSDQKQSVECPEHGSREATFVCQHLLTGQGLGFHQAVDGDDPDAVFPDAWCDACEAARHAEGGWNDVSEAVAGVKLLCSECYQKARLLNWSRSTHAALAELVSQSIPYLQERQKVLRARYALDSYERYDWDQDAAQLVFSNGGVPALVASIQFVGSVSTRSNTWLWSWANPSFVETARAQVRRVRNHGEQHGLLKLACAYWAADEEDGWQMAAVSAFLLQAQGAYRTPDEGGFTFMIMTDVRWAQS